MSERKTIPIVEDEETRFEAEISKCAGTEPYALMVMGDSMTPEFEHGEIILIRANVPPCDGAFVIAVHNDEYIFRQLAIEDDGWRLRPLNDAYPIIDISGAEAVKGVIIQKAKPGNRRAHKFYSY